MTLYLSKLALPLCGFALLSACQNENAPEPPANNEPTCGMALITPLIGQHKDALAAVTLAAPVRIIPEGSAVTKDYISTRTNIDLDADDLIKRAWCG